MGPPGHAIPAVPLRRIEGPLAPDSDLITQLVSVFREARRAQDQAPHQAEHALDRAHYF